MASPNARRRRSAAETAASPRSRRTAARPETEAGRPTAPARALLDAVDHRQPVARGDRAIKRAGVDGIGNPQLVEDRVATCGVPIDADRHVDAVRQRRANICGLVIERQIALWRPDQARACSRDLREIGILKGGGVNNRRSAAEQVLVLQNGKL